MNATVSLTQAETYEPKSLRKAVDEAIALAGGLDTTVKRGDKVFVKVNHLGHHAVDTAITTHPEFAAAVACHLRDLGANVRLGDGLESDGLGYFERSGYAEAAARYGLELVNLKGGRYVNITSPSGIKLALAAEALEADHLINVPKLKTHALTVMTCAVKNFYGLLPQYLRRNLHRNFVVPSDFAGAVADIYEAARPVFHVVDAVVALEGMGPSRGGTPRHLGLAIAGADGVAVDAVAASLIGLNPLDVNVTRVAVSRNLGIADLNRIDLAGYPLVRAAPEGFVLPETMVRITNFIDRLPRPAAVLLGKVAGLTREVPVIVRNRCIGCALCARHCPQEAIRMDRVAFIDYSKCISCFCCQEFCQSDAIDLTHSAVGDFFLKSVATVKSIIRRKPPVRQSCDGDYPTA